MTTPDRRPVIDLNGQWTLRPDADDHGLTQRWFDMQEPFSDSVIVPGAWNVQGFELDPEHLAQWESGRQPADQPLRDRGLLGPQTEADRQRHVHPGPMWYRRTVDIPTDWVSDQTELIFAAVQRTAMIWVNDLAVPSAIIQGSMIGDLVPLHLDVSSLATPGARLILTVRVDARRDPTTDPWYGCQDTLDFLFLHWGGISGPVRLVGSPGERIESVGVTTRHDVDEVELSIMVSRGLAAATFPLRCAVELVAPTGQPVGQAAGPAVDHEDGTATAVLTMPVAGLQRWSPAEPSLYRASISLLAETEIDHRNVAIGLRDLTANDDQLILNGLPFFARGYGDDCIFPLSIAPPHDVETYRERLQTAKEFGFNWVRLHSWVPPEAMLDAADEVGMLIQPELPLGLTWEAPLPETYLLVRQRWRELVLRYRHHPSIAAWCMGNEQYDGLPFAEELYAEAKQLDPGRLVIDSDGHRWNTPVRSTEDFAVVQFGEGKSVGWADGKYDHAVAAPVIAHEVGYFASLPDPTEIDRFDNGYLPYWLTEVETALVERGQQDRYPELIKTSQALLRSCLKINTEAIRAAELTGWSHWLLYDYPTCAEGILTMFGDSKGVDADWFRRLNDATVVLAPGLECNHRSDSTLTVNPLVACWEQQLPLTGRLSAVLTDADGTTVGQETLDLAIQTVRQAAPTLTFSLPTVSTVTPLTLTLRFDAAQLAVENDWPLWIHPTDARSLSLSTDPRSLSLSTDPRSLSLSKDPRSLSLSKGQSAPLIVDRWDETVPQRVAAGDAVIVLDPTGLLTHSPGRYRPAAWDGAGHFGLHYPVDHQALAGLNGPGWCDERFYHLVQGSAIMSLPEEYEAAVIVRALEPPQATGHRTLLAEFTYGEGRVLVSGFRLDSVTQQQDPAAATLLDSLQTYLTGSCSPTVELPWPV